MCTGITGTSYINESTLFAALIHNPIFKDHIICNSHTELPISYCTVLMFQVQGITYLRIFIIEQKSKISKERLL